MKTVEFEWNGQVRHLCMNAAALFDIYDKFGTEKNVLDHIKGSDRETFNNLCWMLWKLMEQGELVRRFQGHDRAKIPAELEVRTLLQPVAYNEARKAVAEAYFLGMQREIDDEEPVRIDKGLLELQKKTAAAEGGLNIFGRLRSFLASLFRRGCC